MIQSSSRTYRNYLRVRGEYFRSINHSIRGMELPPRTRRILVSGKKLHAFSGTTSAYAENTTESAMFCTSNWNYLRVRGEYQREHLSVAHHMELPPRTRRIP